MKHFVGHPTEAQYVIVRSFADPKLFTVLSLDPDGLLEHAVAVDLPLDKAVEILDSKAPAKQSGTPQV